MSLSYKHLWATATSVFLKQLMALNINNEKVVTIAHFREFYYKYFQTDFSRVFD